MSRERQGSLSASLLQKGLSKNAGERSEPVPKLLDNEVCIGFMQASNASLLQKGFKKGSKRTVAKQDKKGVNEEHAPNR